MYRVYLFRLGSLLKQFILVEFFLELDLITREGIKMTTKLATCAVTVDAIFLLGMSQCVV